MKHPGGSELMALSEISTFVRHQVLTIFKLRINKTPENGQDST